MTKLISKIATAVAVLGLAGPALATSGATPSKATGPAHATAQSAQREHKKVAQADEKKASAKKAHKKHKSHAKGTKTVESAPAPAAPAPATK